MGRRIAWNHAPIVHTTRHGWEVAAAQPWKGPPVPVARRHDGLVLSLGYTPRPEARRLNTLLAASASSVQRVQGLEGFGAVQYRAICAGRRAVGHVVFAQREADIAMPTIVIDPAVRKKSGVGSAVVLALMYGTHQAGGVFSIDMGTNPLVLQTMLVSEGFGDVAVQLIRNELLVEATTRRQGTAAYPRQQLRLADYAIEELPLSAFSASAQRAMQQHPAGSVVRHAWWIERIIVPPIS
jgi:hypothetical protein